MKIFPMKTSHLFLVILGVGIMCFSINYLSPELMHTILIPDFSIFGIPQGITTVGTIFKCLGIACVASCLLFPIMYLMRQSIDF